MSDTNTQKTLQFIERITFFLSCLFITTIFTYCSWLFVRCFIADSFRIPSDSMIPTLYPGDKIVVNKLLFGGRIYTNYDFKSSGSELQCFRTKGIRPIVHNDIVAFNYPYHDNQINFVINQVYCKRAVGLPGDSIGISGSFYYNNNYKGELGIYECQQRLANTPDSLLESSIIAAMPYSKDYDWTIRDLGPLYIPRKGDIIKLGSKEKVVYSQILKWENAKGTSHRFKNNYYFMAGDNVSNSSDSRYWGLVPEDYIIGVVGWTIHSK